MMNMPIYDIMLQYRHSVVHDLQVRVLNTSVSTTSRLNTPFSRRIEQPVAPLEVKAHWNKPDVTVKEGQIELSAEISGGARQVTTGRILTLEGEVSVKENPTFAFDTQGRPYACLATPGPHLLNLRQLRVTYEGSRWPRFLEKLNPAKEETVLRPLLATELFGRLARIPLTYMPSSFPIGVPTEKRTATKALPIVRALPGLLGKSGLVAIAFMLDKTHVPPSTFVSFLPPNSPYNAAMGISTPGLNTLLTHLVQQGKATGQFEHSRLGQTTWQWETLTVTLLNQTMLIEGTLLQQGLRTWVQAELHCWLDENGILQCKLLASNTDPLAAETLLVSWTQLLKTLLCAPASRQHNQGMQGNEPLIQRFDIPTTSQSVDAVAQALLVTNGQLIIYYTIPMSLRTLPMEIFPPKASVTLSQPHIPRQAHQGAPVTAKVEARITNASVPPHDYAWTTGLSPEPRPEHGSKLTIHATPPPVPQGGQQQLTTAHLKLIDKFGQVSEAHLPVQYIASSQAQQAARASRRRRNLLTGIAGTAVMLLAGSGAALALQPVWPAIAKLFGSDPPPPSCPPGQAGCNGSCVNPLNDLDNCGQCGNACPSGHVCAQGSCSCPTGLTSCNGSCVNPLNAFHNCGQCGNTCLPDQVCAQGKCQCRPDQITCNGSCVNPQNDFHNCGQCGNACPSGQVCANGTCQQGCPPDQTNCNGNCVDPKNDPSHCGRCGHPCESGATCCGGTCINTSSEKSNCGACGKVCGAEETCINGTCCSACNGVCVDTSNDLSNCGKCGNSCPPGKTCVNGSCQCSSGQNCNGTCTDINSDNSNCGRCGNACGPNQTCVNGTCKTQSCQCSAGQTCCSDECVNINNDPNNCGRCGNPCPSGQNCVNGICCPSGLTNCNGACCPSGSCLNGTCCPQAQICGQTCCPPGSSCSNGKCCPSGQTNCGGTCCPSGSCSNGKCCPSGQTNCGGTCCDPKSCLNGTCCPQAQICGQTCCPPEAPCSNGKCCPSGQTNCGGTCCDPKSCLNNICCPQAQVCGQTCCPSGSSCSNGICCPSGQTNCGGTCCDPKSCLNNICCPQAQVCGQTCCPTGSSCCGGICCPSGSCLNGTCCPQAQVCGQICCPSGSSCLSGVCCPQAQVCGQTCCPSGSSCSSGKCCPSGQTNCGGTCCDPNFCSNGKCCPPGQTNCGGTCTNLKTDDNNCGMCGKVCTGGSQCFEGGCNIP